MIRRFILVLAALSALWSLPVRAWGEYGHRTTAAIALANIKPQTRQRIALLMQAERGLGTATCRVRSLGDAAVWPDCIRRDGWRWGYSFPWHYQTEPVCKPYDPKANCANGNCVSAQIERNRRILTDRSLPAAQRLEALAFLAHFIGDIHMPLHSGDNNDQGGNAIKAMYGDAPVYNLHALWDGAQAERAISSAVPPLVRRYPAADLAALGSGTPAIWGEESWRLARQVYTRAFGFDPCQGTPAPTVVIWTNQTIEATLPDARLRLTQAGLRLARVLDEALGG
ncbi:MULTISPECIES: S1/P1 nuclease [unclassified Novosphingobium]|uniref:S1/P1 nuclease n=1 Tax=unclassified Novosphingobium TaxID=2644732 RepID=UPI000ECDEA0B|nr:MULTISPECIES: S1/P1 nuclease [unclassified Novosphingobium]HCF24710.1 endonuclease [Novosphingobium sp.]HQV02081.1 S1/P1 nuclease [Novosphingobium sp.]